MKRLPVLILFCLQLLSIAPAQAENRYLPGKFVRADLVTPDLATAKAFYEGLFGWQFELRQNYAIARMHGHDLGSLFQREPPKGSPSRAFWVAYMSVPDVDASQKIVLADGGSLLVSARNVPNLGKLAVFRDAEGAVFGTIHLNDGDPEDYAAEPGDWIWLQLFSRDPRAAGDFYSKLAKYDLIDNPLSAHENSYLLASDGYARAALTATANTRAKSDPSWLPFVRVDSVVDSVRRAEKLGGKVLVKPREDLLDYHVAVIADPTGAAIGLLEWQPDVVAESQP